MGAPLACASTLLPRLPAAVRPYLAWAGLAGKVVSLFTIDAETSFPGPFAALPVLSTALVLVAGTGTTVHRGLGSLTNKVSGYIGDISCSLYLWHFPAIVIGTTLFGHGLVVLAVLRWCSLEALFVPTTRSRTLSDGLTGSLARGQRKSRPRRAYAVPGAYKAIALSLLVALTAGAVWMVMIPPTPQPSWQSLDQAQQFGRGHDYDTASISSSAIGDGGRARSSGVAGEPHARHGPSLVEPPSTAGHCTLRD